MVTSPSGGEREESARLASPDGRPPLVPSVETERPISLITRFIITLTLRSVAAESMFFSPDHMAIPYTYSLCEYRMFFFYYHMMR